VEALLDVARAFLDARPEDRSGEDRSLVVVHVDAALLGAAAAEPAVAVVEAEAGAAARGPRTR
jgi:hypothetical protein